MRVPPQLGLDLDCDYALYLSTVDGTMSALPNEAKVNRVIGQLPAVVRGAARFFYKRHIYTPGGQTEVEEMRASDTHDIAHRLSFIDAVFHVSGAVRGCLFACRSCTLSWCLLFDRAPFFFSFFHCMCVDGIAARVVK